MTGKPPELASTIEEHQAAALYHDEKERIMRSAGRNAVADTHRDAAKLHRWAVEYGPETECVPYGEQLGVTTYPRRLCRGK
jgi:hypothetical protein